MRKSICLSAAVVLLLCGLLVAEVVSTEVAGTMVIGADVPSIKGSTVDIRLYEYHPMIADKPATLVDQVQIKNFAHTKGKETKTAFSIGQKPGRKINQRMQYYVTLFIHSGDPAKTPRTHMGKPADGKFLCKVLTAGNPREIVMKVRPVGAARPRPKPVGPKVRPMPVPRPMPGRGKPAANDDFKTIQGAQLVFTADLKRAIPGPVASSMPPIYSHRLVLVVKDVLRGDLKPGANLTIHHSARQRAKPTFPVGKLCLVTATTSRGSTVAKLVRKVDDKVLQTAREATSLPLGWSKKKDKFVSPWSDLGAKAWPKSAPPVAGAAVCSVTGRPALPAGPGVSMKVVKVPPKKRIKWTNPDGDGQYKITITNDTDKPVTVPALLSDSKGILWDESLVILCQNKARPVPGAKGLQAAPKETVLKPKQAVSTVVNTFCLQNVRWPRGGYRIAFQFCLGELSVTKSFYYLSRHHDSVRRAAVAKRKK
ncbi:MAG: hypothetical protein QGH60_02020 [Phycisphaerae bacterium]|jgi:hypothetical protein|nr:hypothetical protein [Phycisphaerae bacterium]